MAASQSPAIWLSAEVSAELRTLEDTHLPVLARLGLAMADRGKGDATLLQRLLAELGDAAATLNLAWMAQGVLGKLTGRKAAERRQLAVASRALLAKVEQVRAEADAFARYSARFEEACLAVLPEYTMHLARLDRALAGVVPRLRTVYDDLRSKVQQASSPAVHEALQRLRAQADLASDHLSLQMGTSQHARRLPLAVEDMRRCHGELEEQLEGVVTSRAARAIQHIADALTAPGEAALNSLAQADRLRTELIAGIASLQECLERLRARQQALTEAFSGLARRLGEVQRASAAPPGTSRLLAAAPEPSPSRS
jgi:chromosome segregation ATPase